MTDAIGHVDGMPVHILSGEPEVADRDGMVLVRYADVLVGMNPEFARKYAEKLARVSYKVVSGDYPTPQKSSLGDSLRIRVSARVALMIKSFEGQSPRPAPKVQAAQIVDMVLKEVT